MSPTMIRREWLTGLIREIHADSRGTDGARRMHAELTKRRGIYVGRGLVTILMHDAGIAGIPGPRKVKRVKGAPTSDDLVQCKFERSSLDELWVTDITERRTRRKSLLLSRPRHVQPTNRRLVDRLVSRHQPRRERSTWP